MSSKIKIESGFASPGGIISTLSLNLADLQEDISKFDRQNACNEHERIHTRLLHVKGRLNRVSALNSEQKSFWLTLVQQHKQLCSALDVLVAPTTTSEAHIQTSTRTEPQEFDDFTYRNNLHLYKWNLTYNGETSVLDFLERVEELRIARNHSYQQLFHSAVELFSGQALHWYRAVRDNLNGWDDLVKKLKYTFLPCDYEHRLWDEIRNRTQGTDEKVALFVSLMENLFNRLSHKPSEHTRLDIIRRNLLPSFQQALALNDVFSIQELVRICRNIEDVNDRIQRFRPPPTNLAHTLEPNLAYRKLRFPSRISAVETDLTSLQYPRSSETTNNDVCAVAQQLCWNCRKSGHRAQQCTLPPKMHCYRCGAPDVTVRTCSKCSGNARRGN
ncbi:hypothetical protein RN001_001579 [Aquatica leii]|uniref:CCHC-type domain-containing protein n=1 Tax=Aquatica leii TaxID=1421715 RepID=A0AAN7PGE8_9COLE|nr:hypothetical protein RN001_001579 [Aquatica leii]